MYAFLYTLLKMKRPWVSICFYTSQVDEVGPGLWQASSKKPHNAALQTTQRMRTAETEWDAQTAWVLSGEDWCER